MRTKTKFAELHDPTWLRRRVEAGATPETLAAELTCGRTTARTALARAGLLPSPPRLGEPPPAPLETATATNGDLDADVADDELARRLREDWPTWPGWPTWPSARPPMRYGTW